MNITQNDISVNWDPKAFGQRIRFIRGSLSQANFARKLGVTQADVSRYEQGKRPPPITVILAMASLGGVSIDFLIRGEDHSSEKTSEPPVRYESASQTLWVGNLEKPDQALLRTLAKRLAKSRSTDSSA